MIAADHTLRDMATARAASVLRLVDLLYPVGKVSRCRDNHGPRRERPYGLLGPTAPSRLAVRAQVLSSLAVIDAATASLDRAATALSEALDHHENRSPISATL